MAGSAIGSIAGGLAGKAVGGLLGGGSTSSAGGSAPVLFHNPNNVWLKADSQGYLTARNGPERRALLSALKDSYSAQATSIRDDFAPRFEGVFADGISRVDDLLSEVTPGFGRLTTARVDANENARQRTVSNLSENLARRRVSGASFAQDSLTRANAEFAQQEAEIRAQSFLEELELTNQLERERLAINTAAADTAYQMIMNAFALDREVTNVDLDEMNYLNALAMQAMSGVQDQMNRNADLAVNDATAANNLAGQIVSGSGLSDFIGGLF